MIYAMKQIAENHPILEFMDITLPWLSLSITGPTQGRTSEKVLDIQLAYKRKPFTQAKLRPN